MGKLELKGTIDLTQFWPDGAVGRLQGSDADTLKIRVNPASVRHDGVRTRFLERAEVIGRGRKMALREGIIEVRLQGVDAPELHFPTGIKLDEATKPNGHFRQCYGERSTRALHRWLAGKTPGDEVECTVISNNVDLPLQVFDSYARVVADVFIGRASVNAFLLRQGHAVPTFYASMLNEEIEAFRELSQKACNDGKGVWSHYTGTPFFDPSMTYRREVEDGEEEDLGPSLLPKLFRRCAKVWVQDGTLRDLRARLLEAADDLYYNTDDFLLYSDAALHQHHWADEQHGVFETQRGKLRLTAMPWEMVFVESNDGKVVDTKTKKVMTSW